MTECCNIEEIVGQTYKRLLNFLRKQTGDNDLAEDIAQDTMLKLVIARNKNQSLANPEAWLFQVAKNRLSDYYRREKIEFTIENDGCLPDSTVADSFHEPLLEDMLPRIMKLMPPKYGEALAMSDLDRYPDKEIADKLGISLAAAKMRIRRARKMLHELVNVCYEIEYSKSGRFATCSLKDSCKPLAGELDRVT